MENNLFISYLYFIKISATGIIASKYFIFKTGDIRLLHAKKDNDIKILLPARDRDICFLFPCLQCYA